MWSVFVQHSQKLSKTPLRCWIVVEETGEICCVHCNSMAGLVETYTHIAAKYKRLWECRVSGLVPSRSVLGSSHLTPSQLIMHLSERLILCLQVWRKLDEIIYELVNENDFTEPTSDSCLKHCVPSTDEEQSQLFHAMNLAGTQPAVLSIVRRSIFWQLCAY